ncbi:unnamed protein product [Danaus chrysippus]|uniref:(African queen) hypothetical protein n=1 Tax=Danaus chrysippus TaxID=151541 RepID=A0A8J2QNA5_9NEOP|nr:unnamed protein product [Danaus chrysippus]
MQVFKRSSVCLAAINKNITRSVTVNKVSVNGDAKEIKLKSWREIPGPRSLPLIGQLHHYFPGGILEDLSYLGDVLYENYGPIAKLDGQFGAEPVIFIFDAEAASQVLWGENRMPYRPSFISLEYYRKVYSNKGKTDIVTGLGTEMRSKRNEKNMIQGKFDEEMNLWALESIGVVALGDRLNCFDPNLAEDSPVKKLIQTVHDMFKYADKLDLNPSLWKYISTPTFKKAMQCYEDQMTLSRYFIDRAIEKLDVKNNNANEEKGVLQKLLEIDKDVAVIMASDMLLAGVDTMKVTFYHQTMSKSDKNFPRPLEYLPERWLAEKTDPLYYGNAHPFAFVPFGFGIRSCIGSLYGRFDEKLPAYLYETYGPIVRLEGNFGSPPMIFLYDAEPAMHIFRNENVLPLRPGFQSLEYFRKTYNKRSEAVESTGLLTEHEEAWKKFRSAVNPVMLQPNTIKLYSGILAEVADDMISRMKSLRDTDNMIKNELDMEMNLWSLESIGLVALGRRLNCFDPNLPEDSPVKELIKVVHDIFNCMDKLDFQPSLWRYFSTPAFKRAMKHYEDQIRLSEYFIEMAIKELKEEKKDPSKEKGILEKLLEIDQKVAVIMASDMLLAGVDTTATTIISLLYLLANNPEKQKKLRNELMTAKDKRPYLRACIKESLRLLPVVGGNFRQTTKEYDVLGYRIPKKMFIVVANQYMSQMEKYYPKPHEYIPERWIVDKNDPLYYGNTHPFVHTPFGFGVRSCIGRRIAELEIETFAAKLIQNFDVRWFGPPIKVRASTLNYLIGPYNFIFNDV